MILDDKVNQYKSKNEPQIWDDREPERDPLLMHKNANVVQASPTPSKLRGECEKTSFQTKTCRED